MDGAYAGTPAAHETCFGSLDHTKRTAEAWGSPPLISILPLKVSSKDGKAPVYTTGWSTRTFVVRIARFPGFSDPWAIADATMDEFDIRTHHLGGCTSDLTGRCVAGVAHFFPRVSALDATG